MQRVRGFPAPFVHAPQRHPRFLQEREDEGYGRARGRALPDSQIVEHVEELGRQERRVFEGPGEIAQLHAFRRVFREPAQKGCAQGAAAEGHGDAHAGLQDAFGHACRHGIGQIAERRIKQGDESVHRQIFVKV